MRRTGLRQASLRHMAAGGTRFKSSSRGLPPRSPDSTPVCAIIMSSISSSGLPEAPLESRSWPARSVITATFDGPLPAEPVLTTPQDGDTPVIVLTRACGRVAPVTRGSDVLARVFPDGARRTGPLPPRSRDGPFGIRSADRQPPRTEFHAFSLARRRVDPVVHLILGTPSVPVRRGRYRGVFPFLRTARGVSIPARGVHGFLLRPFYALVGNLRFSEARAAVAWILGPVAYGSPRGDFFLRHSVLLNALSPPRRGGPLAPASSAPASAPSRERSAHRTRIEAGPQGPSANSSPLPSAAPKRAMRILRLRKIVLLKPGSSGTWDRFQKDTLRVSVVRYDGCAARASGIQLSVYRVSADRFLHFSLPAVIAWSPFP